jgi:hypothetical protein
MPTQRWDSPRPMQPAAAGMSSSLKLQPRPWRTLPDACSPPAGLAQGGHHGYSSRTTGARAWRSRSRRVAGRHHAVRATLGETSSELGVLGIAGSYHGDTISAMGMCEGGTFNSEVDWYKGHGYWFDAPCVGIKDGIVSVESSTWMGTEATRFRTLSEVYDVSARLGSELANTYATGIREKLKVLCVEEGRRYGALVLEPLLLGAGG